MDDVKSVGKHLFQVANENSRSILHIFKDNTKHIGTTSPTINFEHSLDHSQHIPPGHKTYIKNT